MLSKSLPLLKTPAVTAGFRILYTSLLTHKADEADGFKGVAAAERVEDRRELIAIIGGECLVYFIKNIVRYEMREVGADELVHLAQLLKMRNDG